VLRVLVAIVALGALCVAYGVLIERRWFRLVRYRADILPAGGPQRLTVLHLSDLHFARRDARKASFLASLPAADVTVVTGDFLGEPEGVEMAVDALRPVRGRIASWFVLGSNDLYAPQPINPFKYFLRRRRYRRAERGRPADLVAALGADGWEHLSNAHLDVSLDGLPVELAGLHDAHIYRADLRVLPRRSPERLGIAVMHSPDSAPEAAACGYDLVVAGHTHGGQVRLPLVGALVTNSHVPRKLAAGLVRMGTCVVHVSPGLGTSKYAPFRFLCRPEATLLELRPAPAAPSSAPGG
jgi:predicted MPP superfamily phosphohydrolase